MKKLLAVSALLMSVFTAQADMMSPEGNWKTIDDETGKAKSVVKIWVEEGQLNGKIIELIEPEEANPVCDKCEDEHKDQPIIGLQFIWGLKEDDGVWDDGKILDPDSGTVYSAKIEVIEEGKKLDVRGYVGFAFAGRSQVWLRAEQAAATPVAALEEAASK